MAEALQTDALQFKLVSSFILLQADIRESQKKACFNTVLVIGEFLTLNEIARLRIVSKLMNIRHRVLRIFRSMTSSFVMLFFLRHA